jgi:hypothetical protein
MLDASGPEDLTATPATDTTLELASRLPYLTELWVGGSWITDDGLQHLRHSTWLQKLDLCYAPITGDGLRHFSGLSALEDLDLQGTAVDDRGLVHLAALAKLRDLNLSGTQVSGPGLQHLSALTNLEQLDLTGCPGIEDDDLVALTDLKKLKQLTLDSPGVSDAALLHLEALNSLERLTLISGRVTPAGISRLQAALPDVLVTQFWDYTLSNNAGDVRFETARLTVIFEDAVLKMDSNNRLLAGGWKGVDEPLQIDEDVISGSITVCGYGGEYHVRTERVNLSITQNERVNLLSFSLSCPRFSRPDSIASYSFTLAGNGAALKCGDEEFAVGDAPASVSIAPNGTARLLPRER